MFHIRWVEFGRQHCEAMEFDTLKNWGSRKTEPKANGQRRETIDDGRVYLLHLLRFGLFVSRCDDRRARKRIQIFFNSFPIFSTLFSPLNHFIFVGNCFWFWLFFSVPESKQTDDLRLSNFTKITLHCTFLFIYPFIHIPILQLIEIRITKFVIYCARIANSC